MQKTTIAAVIILTAGALFSQDRFDMKVRNYFFAGLAGDAGSLQKGMKICEDILARDPKQPEALVWHGMGLVQQSREAIQKGDQQNSAVLWQRGLDEMDQAEAIAPNDLGVRIVRGAVLLIASQYLDAEAAHPLIEKGLSDYEKAYSVQGPDLSRLGTHKSGELMIGMADAYARLGQPDQAQHWFERIQKDLPGTPYASSAAAWLETKTLAPRQAGCLSCHTGANDQSK
ncbi:MAG: tetratricopeptide repeat protein [Bryobacteraceae bacterium]